MSFVPEGWTSEADIVHLDGERGLVLKPADTKFELSTPQFRIKEKKSKKSYVTRNQEPPLHPKYFTKQLNLTQDYSY